MDPFREHLISTISHSASLPRHTFDEVYAVLRRQVNEEMIRGGDLDAQNYILNILDQLASSETGRFLIEYPRIDSFWVQCMERLHFLETSSNEIEYFLKAQAPLIQAIHRTADTLNVWLRDNLRDGLSLCACGARTVRHLLPFDYENLVNISIMMVDPLRQNLNFMGDIAAEHKLSSLLYPILGHPCDLDFRESLDVIVLDPLDLTPDQYAVFYDRAHRALKPGGVLVQTFFTGSPQQSSTSPWKMEAIVQEDLDRQTFLFNKILNIEYPHALHSLDTLGNNLSQAGFANVDYVPDPAFMYPLVLAQKP